jgi:PEP-CTERM motif
MKTKFVALGSMWLLLGVRAAYAGPITIQVDYEPLTASFITCSGGLPPGVCNGFASLPPPVLFPSTLSLVFELDDSQRAVDGSYDVSAGLQGSFWDFYLDWIASSSVVLTPTSPIATAIAQGGLITDLLLNLGVSASIGYALLQYTLTGGSGGSTYTASEFFPELQGTVEIVYIGTYGISQPPALPGPTTTVPEPSTWFLMCAGLLALPAMRRRSCSGGAVIRP